MSPPPTVEEQPKKLKWYQKVGNFFKKAWTGIKNVAGTVLNIPGVSSVVQGILPGVINHGKEIASQGLGAVVGLANRFTKGKLTDKTSALESYLQKKISAVDSGSLANRMVAGGAGAK